jgi:O-antigen/teichoic acid export membrane protein
LFCFTIKKDQNAGLLAVLRPNFRFKVSLDIMPDIMEETINKAPVSRQNLAVAMGKSTLFGIISRVAQVGTRLVSVPIVIAHLGLDGYGIWSIIMTTSAYMRFGSVGIKSAFQKYVGNATGDGDFDSANRLLSTGSAIMLVLSLIGLIPSAIYSRKLAVIAGIPPQFLDSAASSVTVLAIIMMLSNVGAVFEAIVMGGHRIDLVRKFSTIFTVLEAVAIIILLHYGHGLFAMASVMAISEIGYLTCCYIASKIVMPQIQLSYKYVTRSVVSELVRYAGSYQLVNVLEVFTSMILPLTVLRQVGPAAAGMLAIASRLAGTAAMLPESFLHPILSGGSMIHASGSIEVMRRLIAKAYKMTLGLSLFPLAFLAVFGASLVDAWTGQVDPEFGPVLVVVSLTVFFGGFSMLGLVLYRVSGRAVLDNIRQVIRIVAMLLLAFFSHRLGFYRVIAGWMLAEFIGMLFMIFALMRTFPTFHIRDLLPDTVRLTLATTIILATGTLFARLPMPDVHNSRILAILQITKISVGCLLAIWPALYLTKSVTKAESRAIITVLVPRRFRPGYVTVER